MRHVARTWVLLLSGATLWVGLVAPAADAALGCACLDANNDELCQPGELIDDNDWLKGPTVGLGGNFPGATFLLPAGCNIILTSAPKGGVVVNAGKIIIRGTFTSTPSGGEGVQLNATGDILVNQVDPNAARPRLESGGINKLPVNLANAAVAKSSVALRAGGTCNLVNADLRGNPIAGSGQVGIQCHGEIDIHGSTIVAAGIDIQSLTGPIDALATAGALPPIGIECDDPTMNPQGNNNGQVDPGDFPCTLTFANQAAVAAVCVVEPPVNPNEIRALNNPLVIVSRGALKLGSPSFPGNIIEGRFLINLVAEDGSIDTRNAIVTNHASGTPLGGARIWLFADPALVARTPVLKETSTGPSIGQIDITGACYTSFQQIRYGTGATLVGVPAAPPCRQINEFVPSLNGPAT